MIVNWHFDTAADMEKAAMSVIAAAVGNSLPTETVQAAALVSIAISLKRLADQNERKP